MSDEHRVSAKSLKFTETAWKTPRNEHEKYTGRGDVSIFIIILYAIPTLHVSRAIPLLRQSMLIKVITY